MTERQRKLMFFGQSVLNLLVRDDMVSEDILDRIEANALDLRLTEWAKQEDGGHEFKLTNKPEDKQ